ncbi:MAG: hypothetical protein JSW23_06360 [Planctomycetota bacterium]|nr:MAG: hypothetical protein JSW23_06360 [Planctomycetota bacterium]
MFFKVPNWLRYEVKHHWERLTVETRRWINAHPGLILGVTTASVFVLLVTIVWLSWPEKVVEEVVESELAWFCDLNTGELFVSRSELAGPIEAPSGPLPCGRPAGVRAYVFSYIDEPNESERFIGFLERPNPAAADAYTSGGIDGGTGGAKQWGRGRLICMLGDGRWVPADSKQGQAILSRVFMPNHLGKPPYYCPPE